ncbi:MAG: hypothetical protein K0Q78_2732 [Cellvibrio sp.]|jgi:hypothetical protein|nr:hypothetical protein [Cellvibrio sp.]
MRAEFSSMKDRAFFLGKENHIYHVFDNREYALELITKTMPTDALNKEYPPIPICKNVVKAYWCAASQTAIISYTEKVKTSAIYQAQFTRLVMLYAVVVLEELCSKKKN